MPMSEMPDAFDPNDPAEQGYRGERDVPRSQPSGDRPEQEEHRPVMRPRDDNDERQSER